VSFKGEKLLVKKKKKRNLFEEPRHRNGSTLTNEMRFFVPNLLDGRLSSPIIHIVEIAQPPIGLVQALDLQGVTRSLPLKHSLHILLEGVENFFWGLIRDNSHAHHRCCASRENHHVQTNCLIDSMERTAHPGITVAVPMPLTCTPWNEIVG